VHFQTEQEINFWRNIFFAGGGFDGGSG